MINKKLTNKFTIAIIKDLKAYTIEFSELSMLIIQSLRDLQLKRLDYDLNFKEILEDLNYIRFVFKEKFLNTIELKKLI
jgi:hypothetical protein